MPELLVPAVVTLLVAVLGAYSTYRLGRRSTSGTIDTTQAETLWAESSQMREELRGEIVSLRAEVVSLRADTIQMQADLVVNRAETKRTKEHAARCDRQLAALRTKVEQLTDQPRP